MLKAKDAEYFTNIDIGFASSVYVVTARVRNLARMHSPMLRLFKNFSVIIGAINY